MKLKITNTEICAIRRKIVKYNLKRPIWFDSLSDQEVAECYNGVGSAETARPLRKVLTYVFHFALEAVVVHDVIWSFVDEKKLTIFDFIQSNLNLKINARICLKYKKYNFFYRSWCYTKAWLAQQACDQLGLKSWSKL